MQNKKGGDSVLKLQNVSRKYGKSERTIWVD